VGKTTIVSQFRWGVFIEHYSPTEAEAFHWDEFEVPPDGAIVRLELIDTCGSREFPAMRQLYMRTCRAFLLVFK
jgi:GTPase SAR1 family protein